MIGNEGIKKIVLSCLLPVVCLTFLSCGGSGGSGAPPFLDGTFGTGGKTTAAIGTIDDTLYAIAIQSDGKLVVAGYSNDGSQTVIALARFDAKGKLDTTFGPGGGGTITTNIGGVEDIAFALAIQPSDGKLVVAGHSYNSTTGANEFILVRYNINVIGKEDGTLDTTFNPLGAVPGVVTTNINGIDDKAFSLEVYDCACPSDGKLVAGGYTDDGSQRLFALVRYNTDGSLDAGFGSGGIVTTGIGTSDDEVYSLVIQSDNKLAAAGYSYDSGQGQNVFALARYNVNGSLDTTGFGTGGIVTTIVGGDDAANALAIQTSDGKPVAAGYSYNGTTGGYEFALARYNTDGTLDTTLNPTGTNPGTVTTAFGATDDEVNGLAIQSDGKLLAGGYSDTGAQFVFALARYNTDGTLDTTFNTTGKITTAVGGDDSAQALVVQTDGKPVAAGYSLQDGQYEFALVRYLP